LDEDGVGVQDEVHAESRDQDEEERQRAEEDPNVLPVSFVKRSLGFSHGPQLEVGGGLFALRRIFVQVAHALVSHVQHQANYHGRLRKNLPSRHHSFVVELERHWVLIQFEAALDVAEVVVFKLYET